MSSVDNINNANPARASVDGHPLHEFFGSDPESYNLYIDEAQDGSGRPGIGIASKAIMFWVAQQTSVQTVAMAAATFQMPDEAVAQAVRWRPWMFLTGENNRPVGALTIECEGE